MAPMIVTVVPGFTFSEFSGLAKMPGWDGQWFGGWEIPAKAVIDRWEKAGRQDAKRPAGRRNYAMPSASAAGAYRTRLSGNVGLMVPIRSRPLSAEFAGLSRTGGKLGLMVPMRTLPSSSVAGLRVLATFSELISFTATSIFSPDSARRGYNI
jgi:hypothetical protein